MRVIIIDDSKDTLTTLRRHIAMALPEIEVTEYDPEQQGLPSRDFDWTLYDVVLLDRDLGPAGDGLDWLREFATQASFPPVVLLADDSDPYVAAEAIKRGAGDYLRKQDASPERLGTLIGNLARTRESAKPPPRNPRQRHDARVVRRAVLDRMLLPDGKRIGYRFVRLIGQGAHSRVYLAERASDRLTVVLKVIDVETIQDTATLRRFVHEAELVAELQSPFVVRFYGHGFTSSYGYIAMEFFTRGDLKQRIEHGVAIGDALNYALHIAYGLEAIHSVGIVHRDLKPGNIMFRSDDSLALADFGISKRLGDGIEITSAGAILGTPYYISPEQAQGLDVDTRSDLYSAGIILFELLSGTKAFRADTPAGVVYQHVHAPPPSLPAPLARFQPMIDALLAKSPSDRYQTASELVVNLELACRQG